MKVLQLEESSKNKVIFHKYDRKILSLLCKNVRLPLAKIAKLMNLSRQSIEYRIKVMEKSQLIQGSRTVINIGKLGYQSYHYFLSLGNSSDEKELVKKSIENMYVNTLISYSGKWNYELAIMARNPKEAQDQFLNLIKDFKIINYLPCIILETIKAEVLPNLIDEKIPQIKNIKNDPSFSKQFSLIEQKYTPDEKDLSLMYLLSQNAQLSLLELGRQLHLGRDSIAYRIKKLIRSGYIKEFRPIINYDILSFSVQSILIKSNNQDDKEKFKLFLKNNKNVIWATELFGTWDYLIYILDYNQEEIHGFISNIKTNFPSLIGSYEILFAYKEHKYSFMSEVMKNQTSNTT